MGVGGFIITRAYTCPEVQGPNVSNSVTLGIFVCKSRQTEKTGKLWMPPQRFPQMYEHCVRNRYDTLVFIDSIELVILHSCYLSI